MRTRFLVIPLALLLALPATASPGLMQEEKKTLRDALEVLESLTSVPNKGIPQELLAKADCILIFPSVAKSTFLTGGKSGRGVASCRQPDGGMGAVAFYLVGGASTGFQIGGMSADLVMLIMNAQGVDHLLTDRFTIGGETAASTDPAATEAQTGAQVLSWSSSRGLFVGAVLDGSVVRANQGANARLYGMEASGRQILVDSKLAVPPQAQLFVDSMRKHMAAAVAQEKLEN
ncbi:MAG TPA: lipid-binding SYLF domain-containing protein [Candidatus Polarisedimenticolia bacterium]|nr:lipid-binding SYLF domain-containing protein [Candidatus Polarisedimenticolia bacterium]